ncbi:MAG: hypothetical protein CMI16_12945 [Opitutaceae bacterium]|nr:hypothetical protein [Opitutaceae bacterium]|tara:strand:+ start:223 stop:669 length:447 start_codon:yes stop_codon:yes gene_type:complete
MGDAKGDGDGLNGHNGHNGHNGDEPTTCDEVAQRVLRACRKKDDGAVVTYVGRNDDNQTIVRVRAGNAASVGALQSSMQGIFPFARVRAHESVLDGTLHAEIVVPTAQDEWRFACADANTHKAVRMVKVVAFVLLIGGAALYVNELVV